MRKHRKRSVNSMNSRWKAGRWSSTRRVRSLKAASAGEAVAAAVIAGAAAAVAAIAASTMETSAAAGEKNRAGNYQGSGLTHSRLTSMKKGSAAAAADPS